MFELISLKSALGEYLERMEAIRVIFMSHLTWEITTNSRIVCSQAISQIVRLKVRVRVIMQPKIALK